MKEKRFCAFCKNPITIYQKKHIGFHEFFYCLVLGILLSYSLWQSIDPKLLIFFVLFLFSCEVFILLRWRMFVKCNHCGFDPILYQKHPEKMAPVVKRRMEERMSDDLYNFSRYKFDKLARRKPEDTWEDRKTLDKEISSNSLVEKEESGLQV